MKFIVCEIGIMYINLQFRGVSDSFCDRFSVLQYFVQLSSEPPAFLTPFPALFLVA